MSRRRVASLIAFAIACASCAAVFGFERLHEDEPLDGGSLDGSGDALATDAGSDSSSACDDLGIPSPPADAAPGTVPTVLGALRVLDFGVDVDGGRPQIPGFNLDRVCSVDIASSSCTTKLLPTTFETHAKDKNAFGLDNAGYSLIEYISRFSSVLSAQGINEGIAAGKYGAVLRVDGYNGLADDDSVQVDVFPAVGFEASADGGKSPAFDDGDTWQLDSRFRVGGVLDASTIKSDRAWVTGGRLVARFKELTLPLIIDDDPKPFDIRITDAIITASLGKDASGQPALHEGVVAGRWKTTDFLGQVRTIYIKDASGLLDTTLCDDVPGAKLIYGSVKDTICDGRDIRSDSEDKKGLPCDAVSAAARIEAYSVKKLGTFVEANDGGARCTVAPAIPVGDDCP